ncbi:hypothetical protein Nepgr_024404 [Nepenthes gracilis]|uniref:Uncharacterized protein n=1 Tax=Nepenthes gracilis TaxID=150966 RepID=A0AAD3Y0G5_NEPGR|nr:hypothetical protein Nepgr_024404 [Nepenthes gracilis]
MELPQEVDDYIKQSMDHTLGLPVPNDALQQKLQSLEAANYRLRHQYLTLQLKLKEKDKSLERAREEACLNAQALKKFVEENHNLANECANLVSQCSRLERECLLYDHDREALMEFGNDMDERAKELENRVFTLEEELRRVSEEARFYKQQVGVSSVKLSEECTSLEQNLLDGLISSLVDKEEVAKTGRGFLEANSEAEMYHKLLKMWNDLKVGTRNILFLAAQVQILQKDKEHLRINLHRAEAEVKVLFEENTILDEENKRLLRHRNSETKHNGSGGKPHSSSNRRKSNKRKSGPRMSCPIDRKVDFNDVDSPPREPLLPLQESGTCKK